ncbi:SWR1-complex protein [Rhizoctonia solani AG-3 Rhs1AP]|uniref:SWR1-complex protein 4 n=1 Tax=Rhizoctonia solani AG-3 Rhs1AP TaxID=1086054 RepID=X8JTD8_9AGAM|nr:SWR1-complex protein [Rhizoctonia solani AG-3 Rhs1AP]
MASSADVRDILSLPASSSSLIPAAKKIISNTPARKPDGISREVYALIGDNSPTLVQTYAAPKLKQKPTFGKTNVEKPKEEEKPVVKWEWRGFANGARTDGLKLKHWVKASSEEGAESTAYPFEKYNVTPMVYAYSTDEYNKHLQDPDWSREETDYLFQVAREYDVRFFVMYDRYDFPGGKERTLEDLKHRYYGVCRKLLRQRPWGGEEATKSQLLGSFNFDKDRETTRKEYLKGLFNRTPAQIAEEEALYIEMKRLQQNEARFARDREEILRTLGGLDSGLANLNVDPDYFVTGPGSVTATAVAQEKKKKRRDTSVSASGMDLDTPGTPGNNSLALLGLGPGNKARKTDAKQAANDLLQCITRLDPPTNPTKSGHVAAHARSSRIPSVRVSSGIHAIIGELGLSHDRLVMPTRANIEKLEGLQQAAMGLVEVKRVHDRTKHELVVLKARLEQLQNGGEDAAEREGSSGPSKKGRSRTPGEKQRKRSVSVSSSGTAATSATRGGNTKRQRKDSSMLPPT